jgi:hypothetical protein
MLGRDLTDPDILMLVWMVEEMGQREWANGLYSSAGTGLIAGLYV